MGNHIIGPFKPFTAIIGPNGSGKSNLMDAISFVLGLRSEFLRSTHLVDLIYVDPTEKKKKIKLAFVELVYQVDDGEEIKFRRTIHSSGNAEYSINGHTLSWEAYNGHLKDIGIIVKARNFLGDVESIAQKSPKELTNLIEYVSGSESMKQEYENAQIAAETSETKVIQAFEKKKTTAKEKKQLKEQKDEADIFENLLTEQKEIQLDYYLWQLYQIEKDSKANQTELENERTELDSLHERKDSSESQLKEKVGEKVALQKNLINLEKKFNTQKKTLETKQTLHIQLQEQMKHLQNTIEKSRKYQSTLDTQYKEYKNEIKKLEKELESVSRISKRFEEEEEIVEELKLQKKQLHEYNRLKEIVGTQTSKLSTRLEQVINRQKIDKETLSCYESQKSSLNLRLQQLQDNLRNLKERKQQMIGLIEQTQEKLSEITTEYNQILSDIQNSSGKKENIKKQLEYIRIELQEAKADLRETESDVKKLEILENLKRMFPGVIGRVIDVVKPTQKRYNIAAQIAIGKNAESVIVTDEKTAFDCIQYLKEQRYGQLTFIPLDTIRPKALSERFRQLGGTTKLLFDILQFDESLHKAILYCCSNTLVCDTLEEARQICFHRSKENENIRFKVITIKGFVINKNGIITGGVSGLEKIGKFEEKAVHNLRQQRHQLLFDLGQLEKGRMGLTESKIQQMKVNQDKLSQRIHYAQVDLQLTNEKIEKTDKEIKSINQQTNQLQPNINRLAKTLEDFQNQVSNLSSQIHQTEDEVFREFSTNVGVDNIREYEEKRLKTAKAHSERKLELSNQISHLQNQLDFEKSRDMISQLDEHQQKMKKNQDRLTLLNKENIKMANQLETEKKQSESYDSNLSSLHNQSNILDQVIRQLKEQINQINQTISKIEKQLLNRESQMEQLDNIFKDVIQECRLEQIYIPYMEQTTKKKKTSFEDEKRPIDYSSLTEKREMKSLQEFNQHYIDRLTQINAEMDKIAPNPKAILRFQEIQKRLTTINEDFDNARQEQKTIQDRFEHIKDDRRTRFMNCFKVVSNSIDQIYKQLTKDAIFPLGGTAYLSLENNDEPYLYGIKYNVMPPMKRWRDMDQLSGGEKTIAALALLFSIHQFHSCPFFVLDEIDAALDNINVEKISRFIQHQSQNENLQCIVISLKDRFYEIADSLVGIYRDHRIGTSGILTLDLTQYPSN